ncbi:Regulator of sirC expression, contains transglutaminase-like and TPR domains [Candidatus Kryptonium thompsonii]|nr:Regulator of sirC expression, contains transglutaminase-like and TPR domains [Candidatus Kryptonium thompsoni]
MNFERRIISLVKLLDDEDVFISKTAYEKLINSGVEALPVLLNLRETIGGNLKNLLDEIVDVIKYRGYLEEVVAYFKDAERDIERGAYLVAKFAYPDVNFKEYSEKLDLMALELKRRIYTRENFDDIIDAVNKFFFVEKGFRGNFENYYEPDNIFINRVIDRRLGISITLSLVYILVGRRANLPVYGIDLPGCFVVRYESNGFEIYVDPFNGGKKMSRGDCGKLISQLGYSQKCKDLKRATADVIVKRMFENLALSYKNNGYLEKANKLTEIIKLIELVDENLHTDR